MKLVQVMTIEYFGDVSIYFGIGVQVITALVLGGLVGFDREKKAKAAGIKTNILICLGAALYTSIGLLISAGAEGPSDPARMAAQIVSGIGFLGAGAIIQGKGNVMGMTTAATIWVVAAIGFTIGAGYPLTAAIFTCTVLVVLKMIFPVYRLIEAEKHYEYYQIEILSRGAVMRTIARIFDQHEVDVDNMTEEKLNDKKGERITNVFIRAHRRHLEKLVYEIKQALKVKEVAYFRVAESEPEDIESTPKADVIPVKKKKNG